MKSKRRHELQQSEMVREFGKLRQFFSKYGNYITWGILIAAVIFAIGFYAYRSNKQKQDQLLMRLNRVQIAGRPRAEDINELTELSAQQDNRHVAARAGVMLGDAYFMHYAIGGGDEEFPIEPDEAIAQAEQAYRRVIEQYGDSPREVSRARFGLAKILETRGMFGEARQQYQAILELSGLEGDPIVELAADDLETLDDRTEPVEFAETQPTTATAPATMPAEPEVLPETPLPSDAALPGTPPLVPDGTDSDEP